MYAMVLHSAKTLLAYVNSQKTIIGLTAQYTDVTAGFKRKSLKSLFWNPVSVLFSNSSIGTIVVAFWPEGMLQISPDFLDTLILICGIYSFLKIYLSLF